jgi:hypothetical protein
VHVDPAKIWIFDWTGKEKKYELASVICCFILIL